MILSNERYTKLFLSKGIFDTKEKDAEKESLTNFEGSLFLERAWKRKEKMYEKNQEKMLENV